MKRRPLWLIGLPVLAMSVLGVPSASAASSAEADVLGRINDLRASVGATPLEVDPGLTAVAQRWATQMASTNTLMHNPGLAVEVPAGYTWVAENVGAGTDLDIVDTFLKNSPAHYQNMTNPTFDRVGVGVVEANGRVYVVQDFTAN